MVKKYYYNDELNDDFSTAKIPAKPLGDYKYERGFIWKIFAGVFYRIIVFPIATAYNLVLHHERIKNRKLLKKYRKSGYFLYCNHTMDAGDAYTPSRIVFPKKAYIVVGPQAVQIPVVKHLVPALGGVPVPSDLAGLRKFNAHIK
ncbi:MAG: hypothetical protein IJS67_04930, partial [Clostridia bacterium]|nr:hypothetical protein [Clostridia bacterium]